MLPVKLYSFLGQGFKQGESKADNLVYLTVNIINNYIIIVPAHFLSNWN